MVIIIIVNYFLMCIQNNRSFLLLLLVYIKLLRFVRFKNCLQNYVPVFAKNFASLLLKSATVLILNLVSSINRVTSSGFSFGFRYQQYLYLQEAVSIIFFFGRVGPLEDASVGVLSDDTSTDVYSHGSVLMLLETCSFDYTHYTRTACFFGKYYNASLRFRRSFWSELSQIHFQSQKTGSIRDK